MTASTGYWLIARTPVRATYPCRCWASRTCRTDGHPGYICPCWGRTDRDQMPGNCCSKRHPTAKEA